MSKDLTLVYLGPHDEVEVDQLEQDSVVRGEPVDVPASVAGQAPSGHRTDADYDPGWGLLAQTDTWGLYKAPAAARKPPAGKARGKKQQPDPPSTPNAGPDGGGHDDEELDK